MEPRPGELPYQPDVARLNRLIEMGDEIGMYRPPYMRLDRQGLSRLDIFVGGRLVSLADNDRQNQHYFHHYDELNNKLLAFKTGFEAQVAESALRRAVAESGSLTGEIYEQVVGNLMREESTAALFTVAQYMDPANPGDSSCIVFEARTGAHALLRKQIEVTYATAEAYRTLTIVSTDDAGRRTIHAECDTKPHFYDHFAAFREFFLEAHNDMASIYVLNELLKQSLQGGPPRDITSILQRYPQEDWPVIKGFAEQLYNDAHASYVRKQMTDRDPALKRPTAEDLDDFETAMRRLQEMHGF